MSNETAALATQEPGYLGLASDFSEMVAEELGGLEVKFHKIKIPSGGILAFEIPGDGDEPDTVKEFSAVILCHHGYNAYYKTPFNGGSNPPDCGSPDGATGTGDPGGVCNDCPLNTYGTGKNGGKACQNRRRLFVLREGETFPLILSLPATSLDEFTEYLQRLVNKRRRANSVVTKFSLRKAANKDGVAYSIAKFAVERPLSREEHAVIQKLSAQIKAYSGKLPCGQESSAAEGAVIDPETGEVIEPLTGAGNV